MLKVLRITTLLDFGGIEKRLVNTARVEDNSIEFVFISLGKGGWASEQITKLSRRVIVMSQSFSIPNIRLLISLIRIIKKESPDVVHTSGAEANFHGIIAAWLCRVRLIIGEEVGFPNHGKLMCLLFKFVYQLSDNVIAISQAVKSRIVQLREVSSSKCVVVYNPVSLPEFAMRTSNSQNVINLLLVSRLERVKNIEIVLRILNRSSSKLPAFELVIVGEGTLRSELEEQLSGMQIKHLVSFVGFQSNPERFYCKADIFLLPSFSEGLSNSLLEAMSYGLVCIATKEGGPAELIKHGDTGYLIDPYSESNLESVLLSVLQMDCNERIKIGSRARKFLADGFSIQTYVNNLKKIYNGV